MLEVNFDGLVGPTHNYSGLSYGNLASNKHAKMVSSPKIAALQGLHKMKQLADLGLPQAFLPPQLRPNISLLHQHGFTGTDDADVISKAAKDKPHLINIIYSASSMWCANAATVSSPITTVDGKTHICIANLHSNLHRSQESRANFELFSKVFCDNKYFVVHEPLNYEAKFADEGAANHTLLYSEANKKQVEIFVYGKDENTGVEKNLHFPARQTLAASKMISNINNVRKNDVMFLEQNEKAINAGAFHNDVVFVGHKNVILFHEDAFYNSYALIKNLEQRLDGDIKPICITREELSLEDSIETYLFNSQIVSISDSEMMLIAPVEVKRNARTKILVDKIIDSSNNPISKALYVDCRQSMKNGGGPACLRLRVQMTDRALDTINKNFFINDKTYSLLTSWINDTYRNHLSMEDLVSSSFYKEAINAVTELYNSLGLSLNV